MDKKNNKDFSNEKEIFLKLLSSYSCNRNTNIDLSDIDFNYVAFLASEQGMGSMMYKAIENINVQDQSSFDKLFDYYQKSVFMCAARSNLIFEISTAFEENGIDFMLLKGAILQGYYPSPELRVMSDIDFLIKEEFKSKAKQILLSLKIEFVEENSYQDIYKDCNGLIIEIHFALWGYDLEETSLYKTLWDDTNLLSGKKHTYLLSDNDTYIFTIAHFYKHFISSGVGIRPIFDIWFFLKKNISTLDFTYIRNELSKIGALEFEKRIIVLMNCIFNGKDKSEDDIIIQNYLLRCRTHGTREIAAINEMGQKNVITHFFQRLFPPFNFMARRYRVLKKIPFLLPLMWIYRIICLPFNKNRLSINLEKISSVTPKDTEYMNKVFDAAGIKHKSNESNKGLYSLFIFLLVFAIGIFLSIFLIDGRRGNNSSNNNVSSDSLYNNDNNSNNISSIQDEPANENTNFSCNPDDFFTSNDVPISSTENPSDTSLEESIYGNISWKGGTYKGYLINNIPNGSGEHVIENKLRYVGIFKDGQYHGLGKIEFSDGSYYEGMFENNQSNGEGTLYCANGDIISGNFVNGKPQGYCNYQYNDGKIYIGNLVNGLKEGAGELYLLNGDNYIGNFSKDNKHGYGVYTYSNGDVYSGEWNEGFCTGKGVYSFNDGRIYEGNFENGIMNDTQCKISYPDGSIYTGTISNGILNGKGELKYANGDIAKGNFVSGYLSGEAEYFYSKQKHWGKVIYEKGVIIKYIIT